MNLGSKFCLIGDWRLVGIGKKMISFEGGVESIIIVIEMVEFGLEIGFGLGGKSLEFLYVYL